MPARVAKDYYCLPQPAPARGRNLFELAPAEFNEARVMMTIFDARTVYE